MERQGRIPATVITNCPSKLSSTLIANTTCKGNYWTFFHWIFNFKSHVNSFVGNTQRRKRCKTCSGCTAKDCGKCPACKDKVKYGGSGKSKQCCIKKKCINIASKTTAKSGNYIYIWNQPITDWHEYNGTHRVIVGSLLQWNQSWDLSGDITIIALKL